MAWSPLQAIVTLDQLKERLKLPLDSPTEDEALELQLAIAHELVMDVASQRISGRDEWIATMDTWDSDTAPRVIVGAILEQAVFQYRFRGDDETQGSRNSDEVLCPAASNLVKRLRDVAVS